MDFGALLHYAKKKNDAATKDEVRIEQGFTDGVYNSYKYLLDALTIFAAACNSLCGILEVPHFHMETMCVGGVGVCYVIDINWVI